MEDDGRLSAQESKNRNIRVTVWSMFKIWHSDAY